MIKVKELVFTYPENKEATLKKLSFEVTEGNIFGFLGPSGAGKSTTQKILYGLLKDYEGSVKIKDKEIKEWDSSIYESIGISFELPNHYSNLTAKENLEYFSTLFSRECHDVIEVLDWVGLKDDADKLVKNYSKGMKIRLNVARSLLHRPKILFLDEPTSGLDPVNAKAIKDLILKQKENGSTIFITTHNMTVADQLCDTVAFLSDGEIIVKDSPEVLKKQHGRRYLNVSYNYGNDVISKDFPMDDLGKNKDFRKILDSNYRIDTIHSGETTLENIFIEVTGKELNNG